MQEAVTGMAGGGGLGIQGLVPSGVFAGMNDNSEDYRFARTPHIGSMQDHRFILDEP